MINLVYELRNYFENSWRNILGRNYFFRLKRTSNKKDACIFVLLIAGFSVCSRVN